MSGFTKRFHNSPYTAIAPANNLQKGRTVLVTRSSKGVGYAIARSFVAAQASVVIIIGRRKDAVTKAVKSLEAMPGCSSRVFGCTCDLWNPESIKVMWAELAGEGLRIDTLVLNGVKICEPCIFRDGLERTWSLFEDTLRPTMRMTDKFLAQKPPQGSVVLNVSSAAAHMNHIPYIGPFGASKAAEASMMQHMADEFEPDKLRVINIHPGKILTEANDSRPSDEETLAGDFCVWACTKKAVFLHGRFIWANWDVEELVGMKNRMKSERGMLRIGLHGVDSLDLAEAERLGEDQASASA